MSTRTLSPTADVAQSIRAQLKSAFPLVKFSVRTSRYSMGSSIYISWYDAPIYDAVKAVAVKFERVHRDSNGDILAGGNMYVECTRNLSDAYRATLAAKCAEMGIVADLYGYTRTQLFEAEEAILAEANTSSPVAAESVERSETPTQHDDAPATYHSVHFKLWNATLDTITSCLERNGIPYVYIGSKFMFNGINNMQFAVIEALNREKNQAILFPDNADETEQYRSAGVRNAERVYGYERPTQQAQPSNVIDFASHRAHVAADTLTPDQRLKLAMLTRMLGDDMVKGARDTGLTVDDIWSFIADMTFAIR